MSKFGGAKLIDALPEPAQRNSRQVIERNLIVNIWCGMRAERFNFSEVAEISAAEMTRMSVHLQRQRFGRKRSARSVFRFDEY